MGDALKKGQPYSIEEYENLLARSKPGERYEYANGEIIVLDEYTTAAHNQIVLNAASICMEHFYPRGCRVFTENVRLIIESEKNHRLPDVMVTCSDRDKHSIDAMHEPALLVEVLSTSTQREDTGKKLDAYLTIASLQAYIIVDPIEVWIRVYERIDGKWGMQPLYTSITSQIYIKSLELSFPLSRIYLYVLSA